MNSIETYPPPRVPLRPVLACAEFGNRGQVHRCPTVLDAGEIAQVTSGRVAVALALTALKLPPHAEVLIPAFHCSSMVEPVIWTGARPVFFRIKPTGAVDLEDIQARITPRTGALLVAHYFGFPQDMPRIRQFCDARGIALIEDCAHAFFGSVGGRPLGSFGDYACASPWKFFSAYDGGTLISSRHSLGQIRLVSAGWRYEMKAVINALEQSFDYGRLPIAQAILRWPLRTKDALLSWVKRRRAQPSPDIGPSALDGGFAFEPAWVDKSMSLISKALIRLAPNERVADTRRRHYTRLAEGLRDIPGARAFQRELPQGVIPHVFPLFVDAADTVFPALRRRGVPMLRFGEWLWEGVDETLCPTSASLSRHLAQFPCHQGLTDDEIDWMIGQIRETIIASRQSNNIQRVA